MLCKKSSHLQAVLLVLFLIIGFVAPIQAGVPTGKATVLDANFDDRLEGEALGERGAQAGEPADLSGLKATVVANGQDSNHLLVENGTGFNTGKSLRWEFLNDIEITEGLARIRFNFTPSSFDRYSLGVRENGGSSQTFLNASFSPGGAFSVTDANGSVPVINNTYAEHTELAVVIEFDMDEGTTDMTINGLPVFTKRYHGITDRGVGRIVTGWGSSHSASPFTLDDMIVEIDGPLPLVLDADFEDQPLGQPIGTGGAELGQPHLISNGLSSEIVEPAVGNRILRLENSNAAGSQYARWGFLDNLEVDSGIVVIEMDLRFETLDYYQVYIREAGITSGSQFGNVRFGPTGQVTISDNNPAPAATTGAYFAEQDYRLRLIYDFDAGTYSVWLDDTAIVVDRDYGVTSGRGVGGVIIGFANTAADDAALTVDNLQVGSSDALVLPSELQFLVTPTTGLANQQITPALEVSVLTVFDEIVADGTMVEAGIEIGPDNAILSGNIEATVDGVAKFDGLMADLQGAYQLNATAAKAEQTSGEYLIISLTEEVFEDGFE